ncbi:MAG: GNAT family N-acetyltransferase [Pseudomonadota bacterium]
MNSRLKTSRLLLRGFQLADADEVQRLAGEWDVAKTTLNIPHPYTLEDAEVWINSHETAWNNREGAIFAIESLDFGNLLGAVGLTLHNTEGVLGYWIGKPYWGRGYCTEAAKAVISFGFECLALDRIGSEHLQSNVASGRVMVKAGMRYLNPVWKPDRHGKTVQIETYEIANPNNPLERPAVV